MADGGTTPPLWVDLHWDDGTDEKVSPLHQNISQIRWKDSITPPFHSLSITMEISREGWIGPRGKRPLQGDWLVIREKRDGPELCIAYVMDVSGGMTSSGGRIINQPLLVTAVGWFDFMSYAAVYAQPGLRRAPKNQTSTWERDTSTLMNFADWVPMLEKLFTSLTTDVGTALTSFWTSASFIKMPKTLGGSYMNKLVRVVHNKYTRDAYCGIPKGDRAGLIGPDGKKRKGGSRREYAPVLGPTLNAVQSGAMTNGQSVMDILTATFAGDPTMIEMFPSLEDPATKRAASEKVYDELVDKAIRDHVYTGRSKFGGYKKSLSVNNYETSDRERILRGNLKGDYIQRQVAGAGLRRNPVIIYRVKPFQEMPMEQFATVLKGRGVWSDSIDPDLFGRATWDLNNAVLIPTSDQIQINFDTSMSNAVNAVTVGLPMQPDNPIRFFQEAGLPISMHRKILRDGVRLFSPQWPFFPNMDVKKRDERGYFLKYLRSVACLGAQFYLNAERFSSGTAELRYSPQVRPGEIIRFETIEGFSPERYPAYSNNELVAYVESVEHSMSINVETGAFRRRTRVEFSRGTLNKFARTPFLGGRKSEQAYSLPSTGEVK